MIDYIPDRGDIIWLDLDPKKGREQKGIRPVIVITSKEINRFGLLVSLPITTKEKGYGTEVQLNIAKTRGVVLTNHIRTHDWKSRNARFVEVVSPEIMGNIDRKLRGLLCL